MLIFIFYIAIPLTLCLVHTFSTLNVQTFADFADFGHICESFSREKFWSLRPAKVSLVSIREVFQNGSSAKVNVH